MHESLGNWQQSEFILFGSILFGFMFILNGYKEKGKTEKGNSKCMNRVFSTTKI